MLWKEHAPALERGLQARVKFVLQRGCEGLLLKFQGLAHPFGKRIHRVRGDTEATGQELSRGRAGPGGVEPNTAGQTETREQGFHLRGNGKVLQEEYFAGDE